MDGAWSVFKVFSGDTDSIMFCKKDGSPFSEQEREALLNELNSLYPEYIRWADDGYYSRVIILKAKNYVLYDPTHENPKKRLTVKGSALKSSKLEIACREFQQEIIKAIIEDRTNFQEIYHKYIKEACNIKEIKRWSSKKTYTKKIDESERANETKQKDALAGSNYKEGDKFWLYFLEDGSMRLAEHFDGNYDKLKMCEKIFKSAQIFKSVLPVEELFLNYKLKKNKAALDKLIGI